jgi:hypothetical protein
MVVRVITRRSSRTRRSRPTVGEVLLWGFIALSAVYAVFLVVLVVLGLTR